MPDVTAPHNCARPDQAAADWIKQQNAAAQARAMRLRAAMLQGHPAGVTFSRLADHLDAQSRARHA